MVKGAGGVAYEKTIQITQDAWSACDAKVQALVTNILASPPIQILSSSGRGNGIKLESKGLEFHTQTDSRLQAPGAGINTGTWTFTQCKKGWGH